jgi:hypothetical protein
MQPISTSSAAAPSLTTITLRAIAVGGLAVGLLDATDGVVYFALTAGIGPVSVLQYIASGALGTGAFSMGLGSAALGALLHFALAYGFTAAFVLAWARFEGVRRWWIAAGLGWGAAVWAFMNLVVLPLSRVAPAPVTALAAVHGIAGHAVFVGLAAAWAARRAFAARDAR